MSTMHPQHPWCTECNPRAAANAEAARHHHSRACGCAPQASLDRWANVGPQVAATRRGRRLAPEHAAKARAALEHARSVEYARREREGLTEAQASRWREAAMAKLREHGKTEAQRRSSRKAIRVAGPVEYARRRAEGQTPAQREASRRSILIAGQASVRKKQTEGLTPKQLRHALRIAPQARVIHWGGHDDLACTRCSWARYVRQDEAVSGDATCPRCGAPAQREPHDPGPRFLTTGCAKPQARA